MLHQRIQYIFKNFNLIYFFYLFTLHCAYCPPPGHPITQLFPHLHIAFSFELVGVPDCHSSPCYFKSL